MWEQLIDEYSHRATVGAYRLYVSPDITVSNPDRIRYRALVCDTALNIIWQGTRYASVAIAQRVALEALTLELRRLLDIIAAE